MASFIAGTFFFMRPTDSNVQSYHSGDAVSYNTKLIAASADTGNVELFVLNGEKLVRASIIANEPSRFSKIYGVVLNQEGSNLYAYAATGDTLSKYDISNVYNPVLIQKAKDNTRDWFLQVKKTNSHIATIGEKEVKLWNYDLQTVNGFKLSETKNSSININFSPDERFLFEVQTNFQNDAENDFINIIDTRNRQSVANQQIVLNEIHDHEVYYDSAKGFAYIAGDRVLKQINTVTGEEKNFRHISDKGYDVVGISGSGHFYFSDGVGIVKMDHELKPIDWVYTYKLGMANGWTMGMKAIMHNNKETLVVFNHESIAVLNDSLDLIADWKSTDEDPNILAEITEAPSLSIDKNRASKNSQVSLRGAGFLPNERVSIMFGKYKLVGASKEPKKDVELSKIITTADGNGRFTKILTVPEIPEREKSPYPIDIIAEGLTSGVGYNLGFLIE
jgi:hypothetical protein